MRIKTEKRNLADSVTDPATGLRVGPLVDMAPARRPQRTVLSGRWVTVAPLDPARDEESLFSGMHGPDKQKLWLYLAEGPFPDRQSFRTYLEKRAKSEDPLSFAIVHNESGKTLGQAAYMRIVPEHRVIEVGNIFYTPTIARSTEATEAMYLMARHVFEDLGYRRYEWKCNTLNEPSRRAALRLGFSFEGVFRQHMIQKGRSRDTAWYAMTDAEWPRRKARFERWLAPDNFDQAGRQRLSLSAMTD
jgi:RimJ/RimL family protein N-acetyltransferase